MKQVQALAGLPSVETLLRPSGGQEVKMSKVIVKQRKTKRRGEASVEDTGHRSWIATEATVSNISIIMPA